MDSRVLEFRAGVADLVTSGRGRRYPRSLQILAVHYWQDARRDGEVLRDAAADLGISDGTLQRWTEAMPEDRVVGALREVVVKDSTEPLGLSIVTPEGYRIEGLDVTEVSLVLRSLR